MAEFFYYGMFFSVLLLFLVVIAVMISIIVGIIQGMHNRFWDQADRIRHFLEYYVIFGFIELLSYPYHVAYRLSSGKWSSGTGPVFRRSFYRW